MILSVRDLVKNVLSNLGYEIRKKEADNGCPPNLLELAVEALLASRDALYLIQIGANDGIHNDPVRPILEKRKNHIEAVLVEPLPHMFRQLEKNYQGFKTVRLENVAVDWDSGTRSIYFISDHPDLPLTQGLASFDRNILLKHKPLVPDIEEFIKVKIVKTVTLTELLSKHNFPQLDLFVVDAEGFDFEVLKMLLQTKYTPIVINYEYVHLSLREQVEARRLLTRRGYEVLNCSRDTFAVLKRELWH